MEAFKDESTSGNERAFRRGPRVPNGDVNLAWVDAPALNPKDNIIIIDTTNLTPENAGERSQQCRIFTANQYGILEDYETGDDLVQEEYPIVADTFSVDEDWSVLPGSEYESKNILGYVHVSRYFHVDDTGLASPNLFKVVEDITNEVKIVDSNGKDYVDANGERRYRIALTEVPGVSNNYSDTQTAYRVWAYVDTDTNEGLYLKYNKVELDNQNLIRRQNINHTEILNPRAYYTFVPEETEVQDDSNRNKRIYTTKSVFTKEKILGKEVSSKDGYRVYVPKKAVPDPRLFQIFRWRVACDVSEKLVIDPARSNYVIKAGVLQLGNEVDDCAPYVFYNLELSDYNVGGLKFINPLIETRLATDSGVDSRKNRRDYWTVNFDTITYEDLAKFDFLFLHPGSKSSIDLSKYMAKIKYFTEICGGTMVIETGTHVYVTGTGVETTASVNAVDGTTLTPGPQGWAYGDSIFVPTAARSDDRFDGGGLGGWDFAETPAAYDSLHPAQVGLMYYWTIGRGRTNYITSKPIGWTSLVQIKRNNIFTYDKLVVKDFQNGGSLYFSNQLFGSALEDPVSGQRVSWNRADQAFISPDYQEYVSSWTVEGNYKLLYNMVLKSISKRLIDKTDLTSASSNWSLYGPWGASWVIDGDVLTEGERSRNDLILHSRSLDEPDLTWVRMLGDGKTVRELFDESQDAEALRKIEGMERTYRLEVSNSYVEGVPDEDINAREGSLVPYVWTDAYSPPFTVPPEIGAHVIDEEPTMDGYQSAQLVHKSYPPKPYGMRADIIGTTSHQSLVEHTINWSVAGTAQKVTTSSAVAPYNWRSAGGNGWHTYDTDTFDKFPGSKGLTVPKGIDILSQSNYYTYRLPMYPSFGAFEVLDVGSYGELVSFVQRALNYFIFFEFFTCFPIQEDGVFGPITAAAVSTFQEQMNCRLELSGVVDSETWAAIGYQCLRLDHLSETTLGYPIAENVPSAGLWHRWFGAPRKKMARPFISDGISNQPFMVQSQMTNSPQYVFDAFQISLASPVDIVAVDIIPYTEGLSNTVRVEGVDVHHRPNEGDLWSIIQGGMLTNYPIGRMRVPLHRVVRDGETLHVPMGPWNGDTVVVALGQDQPSGRGASRILGLRDVLIYTKAQHYSTSSVNITASGTITIKTGEEKIIDLKPDAASSAGGQLKNIAWGAITITPDESEEELYYALSEDGTKLIIRNLDVQNGTSETVHFGKPLTTYDKELDAEFNPGNVARSVWYSMNENGRLNPGREMGYISKTDGIKLFCDANKRPIGFPANAQGIGTRGNIQRHFALVTIAALDADASVLMGFYDFNKKEFILDKSGFPRMTFMEYLDRGPQNVYLAAITNYEEQKLQDIGAQGAPPIPFKWAKPVYGLCFRSGSQIGIESFPDNLGPTDFWSIPIRTGSFTRQVKIPTRPDQPLTVWTRAYQNRILTAFYSVPEANNAGWSPIHGRPYIDVKDEAPIIISDNVIQVRQPPIHMVQEPAAFTSYADPVFPAIRIWTRETVGGWTELTRSDIKDYNASNGIITLKRPLVSADPNLIKVSYTTARASYQFKKTPDGKILNLNPYPGHSRDLIGRGLYIYLVPTYVKDELGFIIDESRQTTTLRMSFNDNLFNPFSPDYDPLVVHIGTIFVTTALDINDLKIMDTRRRGGGAPDNMVIEDIKRVVQEGAFYWDVAPGSGIGYQQGGFVVIRLPEALKIQFSKEEIMAIIDRNITAGVRYKIETTDGSDW